MTSEPPEHVRATFGLRGELPVAADGGWRCGDVVLTPVVDPARAAWSAKTRETLDVGGMRVARPVRSTDGRYVVSGWRADTYVEGTPEPRHDEVVAASLRLHEATAELERPRFLSTGPIGPWMDVDVFVAADRAAWEPKPLRSLRLSRGSGTVVETTTPDGLHSVELIDQLSTLRKPVTVRSQLVHGDLFGTVLFSGTDEPGLTDLAPYWRPAAWAAAVAVVDALAWGDADDGLAQRWADLPEWPQMLLRAVMFRLGVHAMHPRSTAEALTGLTRTADMVRFLL